MMSPGEPCRGAAEDRWLSAAPLALAAITLGWALQLSDGMLDPIAMLGVLVALGLTAVAVCPPRAPRIERLGDAPAMVILTSGVVLYLVLHLTSEPGIDLAVPAARSVVYRASLAAAAVAIAAGLRRKSWLGPLQMPLLLGAYLAAGAWVIHSSHPRIDVITWHTESFAALAHGANPWALTMPNIYGDTKWYGAGLADAAHVHFGYPYLPLSLALAAPGYLLGGDYRYSNLLAIAAAGALIAATRPGRLARTAAAAFLFTPRGFYVLELGWTEALVVLSVVVVLFCACRTSRALPAAVGAAAVIKQYALPIAPLALLLLPAPSPRRAARFLGSAAAVAAGILIPFMLWDPRAFLWSAVRVQMLQPYRSDALSVMSWTARHGVPVVPVWASFAVLLLGVALAWRRAARTPAGFTAATALAYLGFFAFAKQAFCNYYFFVVGLLCAALAVLRPPTASASADEAPRPLGTAAASRRTLR